MITTVCIVVSQLLLGFAVLLMRGSLTALEKRVKSSEGGVVHDWRVWAIELAQGDVAKAHDILWFVFPAEEGDA